MKQHLIKILVIATLIFWEKLEAQEIIINIEDSDGEYVKNAYYKDSNNLLDSFVGTYIGKRGETILKIALKKAKKSSRNDHFYEDLLIGEYQVIENGIEKVNTLPQLEIEYNDQSKHSISGNDILTGNTRGCEDCGQNEIRIAAGLTDKSTKNFALIQLRKITVDNKPAINLNLYWQHRTYKNETEKPLPPSFLGDEYILMKL